MRKQGNEHAQKLRITKICPVCGSGMCLHESSKHAEVDQLLVVASYEWLSPPSGCQALTSRALNSRACPWSSGSINAFLLDAWLLLVLPGTSWVEQFWQGVLKWSPSFLCDVLHSGDWLCSQHNWCSLASIWILNAPVPCSSQASASACLSPWSTFAGWYGWWLPPQWICQWWC